MGKNRFKNEFQVRTDLFLHQLLKLFIGHVLQVVYFAVKMLRGYQVAYRAC
jgi:hypothetical protein